MKFTGSIVTIFGLFVLFGGLWGYLTAESLPSLIAGTICGALLFASGLGLFRYSVTAFFTATSVTVLLAIFFGVRYYQTLKTMPSGIMALYSVVVLLLLLTTKGQPIRKDEKNRLKGE